ncbi:hypothetical protein D3C75_613720 [compost metagenome]
MHLKHVENMVGRCQNHFLAFSKNHGLQHVDRLGNVSHPHPVIVLVENIQGQAGNQGIADRVLLIEEARIGSRLDIIPGSPFIDDQADTLLMIILIHNYAVAGNQLIHVQCLLQRREPFIGLKTGSRAFIMPFPCWQRVIMQCDRIHEPGGFTHEHFCPVIVICIRTAGNPVDLVVAVIADIGLVTAVQIRIIFGTHIAAAAPVLIPHAKISHAPRLLASILLAQLCHR